MEAVLSPENCEKFSRSSEALRADYMKYLESRTFEHMNTIRPWGINSETTTWLLIDALAEEFAAELLPLNPDHVDTILKSYWNLPDVQEQHCVDEIKLIKIEDKPWKKLKEAWTTQTCLTEDLRIFTDFGGDIEVLREVAVRLAGDNRANKLQIEFDKYQLSKCPALRERTVKEVKVVSLVDERRETTYLRFSEEEPVGVERWDWLKEEQSSARKQETVDSLRRLLFGGKFLAGDKAKDELESLGVAKRTRKASLDSLSSGSSRLAASLLDAANEVTATDPNMPAPTGKRPKATPAPRGIKKKGQAAKKKK